MENIEYSLDSFGRVRKTIIPILNYTESQEELLKKEVKMEYVNDFGIRKLLIENQNLREENLRLIDRAEEVNEMRERHLLGLQAELGGLYADKEKSVGPSMLVEGPTCFALRYRVTGFRAHQSIERY